MGVGPPRCQTRICSWARADVARRVRADSAGEHPTRVTVLTPSSPCLAPQALTTAGILDGETAKAYGNLFSRFMRQQRKATLDWDKLTTPGRGDMVVDYADLEHCPEHEPLQHVRGGARRRACLDAPAGVCCCAAHGTPAPTP